MAEGAVDKPPINRRRIIERPRLTRLLDESQARIKMLVAPAGYGKTTLARQWLSRAGGQPYSWVSCSPASSDVAVLLEQIAGASNFGRARPSETVSRLRTMAEPARQLPLLIELLAEDLSDWPDDAWLVLDDYHEIIVSTEAEDVVAEMIARTRVNTFITSRRRPSWASVRGLFYGELYELTQNHLAMTTGEIGELLSIGGGGEPTELVAMASGWPAFISLAAGAESAALRSGDAQTDLYDFLLNEIFAATDMDVQHALRELALAPRDHGQLLRLLHPPEASMRIASEATRVGMLTLGPEGELELHPLLRQFLQRQCLDAGPEAVDAAITRLWPVLHEDRRWDDLFDLIVSAETPERLSLLLRECVDELLSTGRAASLRRWITYAKERGVDDWIVCLAGAKLAIREGTFGRARMFALEAVDRAASNNEDLALAWCIAGQAAHLQSDEESALSYYRTASTLATSLQLQRVARWGRFVSSVDAESPDAAIALSEIATDEAADTTALVDRWNAQLLYEIRVGGLRSLQDARVATEVIDLVEDPVRRTAFRSVYASALALAAEYQQARAAAESFLSDARTARVDFALPYAHTVLAVALLGLREFKAAADATRQAVFEAERLADTHAVANARAVNARLLLAQGRHAEAIEELEGDFGSGVTRAMMGESIGCGAIALACLGDENYAQATARAREVSSTLEPKMLAATADAIFHSVRNTSHLSTAVAGAVDTALETGAWDLFVCGYRAHPEFLLALRDEPDRLKHVLRVMERAADLRIAQTLGVSAQKRGAATLSPRESEIHALVALGLTNKQIAQRLFISEATAKVHVHHILEKLEVKTRTAAAARYQPTQGDDQATETSG